ncbi:Rqc2 family fibronectin-binding protein [Xylocopilactobacillus apicola]|uniref:Rqc2 homolog RqcH n=1 Tax=Xylocopilactobacillus apicola TaxID=2932184 RepID=A0AAU9D884_9LACO|nr:NFACT RNA binding domain-containing protein [Xylocopilactobacillus apicola]BDR58601.1 hypothetical protein XA3_10420 [Xylocopilactobacillus apicola]
MSFDGTLIHTLINELNPLLAGGRITKIQMPSAFEIILTIRQQRKNRNLEISIHPEYQRVNFTKQNISAPARPYPFTMILRKYLQGSLVEKVEQIGNDRIVLLHLTNINDLGDKMKYTLVAEMLGRHANVLILNDNDNKIIDLLKKENLDVKGKRVLLPGFVYELPILQQKLNPFEQNTLNFPRPTQIEVAEFLRYFQGFGKDTFKELQTSMLAMDPSQAWSDFFDKLASPHPTIYYNSENQPVNFTAFPYQSIDLKSQSYLNLSELLDTYYAEKSSFARNKQAAQAILTHLDSLLKKDHRKLLNLEKDLKKAQKADDYRIKGDLITINLNEIHQGAHNVSLENSYEPGTKVEISLEPELSPQRNAQKYYKKYRKLQNSLKYIDQQIKNTKAEIEYLETVLTQIDLADYNTLGEIRQELIKEKYLKVQNPGGKTTRPVKSKPLEFKATDGTKILVGRNNLQNERLTLREAQKTDYWLHTKNIPGSHVVLKTANPSEQTIYEGAMIAAFYSKSRHSAQVPVDYVPIKNIKKPNGTKPGFVIFTGQKTISVTPEAEFVAKLKV